MRTCFLPQRPQGLPSAIQLVCVPPLTTETKQILAGALRLLITHSTVAARPLPLQLSICFAIFHYN